MSYGYHHRVVALEVIERRRYYILKRLSFAAASGEVLRDDLAVRCGGRDKVPGVLASEQKLGHVKNSGPKGMSPNERLWSITEKGREVFATLRP